MIPEAAAAGRAADRVSGRRITAAVLAVGAFLVVLPMMLVIGTIAGAADPGRSAPSAVALADIPADALGAYLGAAAEWDLDWAVLAGIGKLECDHGRSTLEGCLPDTMNHAGARGYMQFIGSTWRRGLGQHELEDRSSPAAEDGHGYATDGDGDGSADPWSWPDATASAARYLVASGAAENISDAVYAYNHDQRYVEDVLALAASYRDAEQGTVAVGGPVPLVIIEGIQVHADLGPDLAALLSAARDDGHRLSGGGYRDNSRQIELRRQHCGTSHYAIYEMPASECSPPTARPGASMHEQGLAIDFTCEGVLLTRSSPCFRWLQQNADDYGLKNLPSEPWHFSTDGR